MSHSFYNLVVHAVFSTKDWQPLIKPEIETRIHYLIRNCLRDLECKVIEINGTKNHLHILFNQNPNKSVTEIIKNIKGNSSH
jgi:REP element-mobilizing transposase RayT